jgi:GT2 family glycosyltransferase
MASPLVSIVTVNWNDLKHLKGYFKSLSEQKYDNIEIIISDNGSTDGSIEFIKENYPKTILIENGSNIGPSLARNQALERVNGKYVQFLDNDVEVDPNFLVDAIKRFEEDPTIGGAQNRLMVLGSDNVIDYIIGYYNSTGFFQYVGVRDQYTTEKYGTEIEVFTCKSAGMIVRKDILDKIGGYDKDMFIYVEDTDLMWRVWLAGSRIVYLPNSVVNHASGSTATADRLVKVDYLSFRNRILTLIKNLEGKNVAYVVPLHCLLVLGVSGLFFLKGNFANGWALWRAVGWNIQHWNESWQKHRYIQRHIRTVSDESIFKRVGKPFNLSFYLYWTKSYLTRWKDFGWTADRESRERPVTER